MPSKKHLLLLLKGLLVYVTVFILWLVVSPFYLELIGFASSKLLPVILVENYWVDSYAVTSEQASGSGPGERDQLRYNIKVNPAKIRWIQFGARDLTYPIVTFITLVLVTPRLKWKYRVKLALVGFFILWLFYSLVALLYFRITSFQHGAELANLGVIENVIGIERLTAWKQGGGLIILLGQLVPVAIWFAGVFPAIFKGRIYSREMGPRDRKSNPSTPL